MFRIVLFLLCSSYDAQWCSPQYDDTEWETVREYADADVEYGTELGVKDEQNCVSAKSGQ